MEPTPTKTAKVKPLVKLLPVRNHPKLVKVLPTENIGSVISWAILSIVLILLAMSMTNGVYVWAVVAAVFARVLLEKVFVAKFYFTSDLIFIASTAILLFGGGIIAGAVWLAAFVAELYGRWVSYGHVLANDVQVKDKLRYISPEQVIPDTN